MRGAAGAAGASSGIPPEVLDLIALHIDSVEQLEVLLLLHGTRDRSWTPAAASEELRTNESSTRERLADLAHHGLVALDRPPDQYRYLPRTPEQARAVAGLAEAYATRRVSVITHIFAKPLDKIRSFADAFRLRRESDG